jgi:tRNA nucleotidyltransferase/poly(A) polymerase
MSDYMFMLESHLNSDQSRVVSEVQAAALQANVNLFLTGGAMRDMLGRFPIVEIDFTAEGNAVKLAKTIAEKTGAQLLRVDETRKVARLLFPGNVPASIGMARQEKYAKPGGKPQVQPATIHEDLRGRDFTINSIALSLSPASRGLLLDPNNGVGDLEHKELRAGSNYTLYDDPVRLLRLVRFRVRLGFTVSERTKSQYENAREAALEQKISPQSLLEELRHIANEQNVADVVHALDEEKLMVLFEPELTGPKLNMAGLQKLQKVRQLAPSAGGFYFDAFGLFVYVLTEKLSAKEKASLISATGMEKEDVDEWQKLEARAKKLEKDLKSAKLSKPSNVYHLLSKSKGEEMLFLLYKSSERTVQDRIKNYFQKYLPTAQEITERDVVAAGGVPGTPKFQKLRDELISTHLDARPKKVVPPPENEQPVAEVPPPPPVSAFGRKL